MKKISKIQKRYHEIWKKARKNKIISRLEKIELEKRLIKIELEKARKTGREKNESLRNSVFWH